MTCFQCVDLTRDTQRVTELLDIAPIDFFTGMHKDFISNIPEESLPKELYKQALDIDLHWVNENGGPAKLTGGLTVQATVSSCAHCSIFSVKLQAS
jgi:hypothetical protein